MASDETMFATNFQGCSPVEIRSYGKAWSFSIMESRWYFSTTNQFKVTCEFNVREMKGVKQAPKKAWPRTG